MKETNHQYSCVMVEPKYTKLKSITFILKPIAVEGFTKTKGRTIKNGINFTIWKIVKQPSV